MYQSQHAGSPRSVSVQLLKGSRDIQIFLLIHQKVVIREGILHIVTCSYSMRRSLIKLVSKLLLKSSHYITLYEVGHVGGDLVSLVAVGLRKESVDVSK